MSVEQTTQLIQLVLNSVLMTIACALIMSRIWARHTAIESQLQLANRYCADLLEMGHDRQSIKPIALHGGTPWDRLLQTKKQVRQLQHRYTVVNYSLLAAHYAFLLSVVSTLILALRTLLNVEWLIPIALGSFVLGVSVLLLSVGLTLIDLHTSDRSLWQEVAGVLTFDRSDSQPRSQSRSSWQWRQRQAAGTLRESVSRMKPSKARVG